MPIELLSESMMKHCHHGSESGWRQSRILVLLHPLTSGESGLQQTAGENEYQHGDSVSLFPQHGVRSRGGSDREGDHDFE